MSKKFHAAFVPLIAVVACAALPATTRAEPAWYACKGVPKETGNFTTIGCATEKASSNFEKTLISNINSAVLVTSKLKASTKAVLKTAGGGVECSALTDESYLWNQRDRGRGITEVSFTGCTATGEISTCTVATPILLEAYTRLEEVAGPKDYDKYFSVGEEPFTEVTLTGCAAEGKYPVTGTARGEIPAGGTGGKVQKFNAGEKTLKFLGKEAEFTGETETEGAAKTEGIFLGVGLKEFASTNGEYPVEVLGRNPTGTSHGFYVTEGTVACKRVEFYANPNLEPLDVTMTLEPKYSECEATIAKVKYPTEVTAECPKLFVQITGSFDFFGGGCVLRVKEIGCVITIPEQGPLTVVGYSNVAGPKSEIKMSFFLGGIGYTTKGCGIAAGGVGEYFGVLKAKGYKGLTQVGIEVR